MSIELTKLLALVVWTAVVAGATWQFAKTRYELREERQATQALVVEKKRSQHANGVAGAHEEWRRKHVAAVKQQEVIIETLFTDDHEVADWDDQPIPPRVRAAVAAAAATISTTSYADHGLPGASGPGSGDERRHGEGLAGGAGRVDRMPRPASAPH